MTHSEHFYCAWFHWLHWNRSFIHISPLQKSILYSFQLQIQWNQFLNVYKIMPDLRGTFTHFYKKAFCRQLADPLNPLYPSYWNVPKYPLIQSHWNHFCHSSYDQGYPRKFQLLFLEHFYFCLVVVLIVIVSDVSWRRKRSTWRRTGRFQDWWTRQAALLPCLRKPFCACHIAPHYQYIRSW
jgi:hypothetical protein